MMGHTHWVIGAGSWLGLLALAPDVASVTVPVVAGGLAISAVLALGPDIDTKGSMASKALGPITGALSYAIRKLFGGHRKITHSFLGWLLVTIGMLALVRWGHMPMWVDYAAMCGWASHITADMITHEGCPLLWPFSDAEFGIHLVKTGGRVEKYVVRPIAVAAVIGFGVMLAIGM